MLLLVNRPVMPVVSGKLRRYNMYKLWFGFTKNDSEQSSVERVLIGLSWKLFNYKIDYNCLRFFV